MLEIGNSGWMYLLGIIVTVFVIAGCLFFIIKSLKDAKKLNMDKNIIKKTIISSIIFTILPSISILVGIFALAGQLGIPLPWIRLSVIGALHYEGIAADTALGFLKDAVINDPAVQIVTVTSVMTLGILTGPVFCLFGFKAYDKKLLAKANSENKESVTSEVVEVEEKNVEETPKKKKSFGDVLFNAVFIAMVCAFIIWDSVEPFLKFKDLNNATGEKLEKAIDFFNEQPYLLDKLYIPIIVALVSFGCMALCEFLEKKCKQKWLSDFSLGLSMIVGMAAAAIVALL